MWETGALRKQMALITSETLVVDVDIMSLRRVIPLPTPRQENKKLLATQNRNNRNREEKIDYILIVQRYRT